MPNYNEKTKLAYGVVDARNVPFLMDAIIEHGDDLTWEAAKRDLRDKIRGALRGVVEDYSYSDPAIDDIVDACNPGEIMEAMLDAGLSDRMNDSGEGHEYHLKTDDCEYLLGYLGGAPIIWVMDSPYVAYVRGCSPCIPGAGDLDTIDDSDTGIAAHCCPPDCFETHDVRVEGCYHTPYWQTINGRSYKIVQRQPAETTEE
jgi:hypothetical protein